ncbi:hypothetical protein DXG01_016822 [Tephrocybe rancida]|nr:hypothetical protein DXG01_016822 [Tephrocybe rancida]
MQIREDLKTSLTARGGPSSSINDCAVIRDSSTAALSEVQQIESQDPSSAPARNASHKDRRLAISYLLNDQQTLVSEDPLEVDSGAIEGLFTPPPGMEDQPREPDIEGSEPHRTSLRYGNIPPKEAAPSPPSKRKRPVNDSDLEPKTSEDAQTSKRQRRRMRMEPPTASNESASTFKLLSQVSRSCSPSMARTDEEIASNKIPNVDARVTPSSPPPSPWKRKRDTDDLETGEDVQTKRPRIGVETSEDCDGCETTESPPARRIVIERPRTYIRVPTPPWEKSILDSDGGELGAWGVESSSTCRLGTLTPDPAGKRGVYAYKNTARAVESMIMNGRIEEVIEESFARPSNYSAPREHMSGEIPWPAYHLHDRNNAERWLGEDYNNRAIPVESAPFELRPACSWTDPEKPRPRKGTSSESDAGGNGLRVMNPAPPNSFFVDELDGKKTSPPPGMDKFTTLEPVRLYASSGARLLTRSGTVTSKNPPALPLIGRLPSDLHQLILSYLPIPDVPSYARSSRALNALVKDEKFWDSRFRALGIERYGLGGVLDTLEGVQKGHIGAPPKTPTHTHTHNDPDEFGDFASVEPISGLGFGMVPPVSLSLSFATVQSNVKRTAYIRAHALLKPLALALGSTAPHLILSTLATFFSIPSSPLTSPTTQNQSTDLPLRTRAKALRLLSLFLSPPVQPLRAWVPLRQALQAATDRFDAGLLAAFDSADGRGDEVGMREAAESSWEVWDGVEKGKREGEWEMGRMWAEKREIFYLQGQWDPLANFTPDGALDFDAMDAFMSSVLSSLEEHGARAVRVFPPSAQVLLSFADRVATEVVGEYITTLLTRARATPNSSVFLQATAASFKEAWRIVDALLKTAKEAPKTHKPDEVITLTRAEDVVEGLTGSRYQMFESNMDEYLDEEIESVKNVFDGICRAWDRELETYGPTPSTTTTTTTSTTPPPPNGSSHQNATQHAHQPRFLSSQNPAQVKRNVLASFTSVLLLPVTIVPRTVGAVGGALVSGGNAAVQGIAMLNPARWGGGGNGGGGNGRYGGGVSKGGWGVGAAPNGVYKTADSEKEGSTVFEVGEEAEEEEDENEVVMNEKEDLADPWAKSARESRTSLAPTVSSTNSATNTTRSTATTAPSSIQPQENKLELLLSLDVALSLIHADREALKRVETFAGYPGHYGHRVRDTIEEVFVLMLSAVGIQHLGKGFARATEQMRAYKPAEHASSEEGVAPLLQFFELVHVGDTIQSMVQVYFDKELWLTEWDLQAHHIDRTDFLNGVVREKKRFENALDDSVAGGLNAGTEVLMAQVEHIILTLTGPREYYPEDGPLDLGPTRGCAEAIRCLEMHCRLLKGSTSKEVLEVFYQEVGIRLIACVLSLLIGIRELMGFLGGDNRILQKHIKRQIISLNGGFRVIADLNNYYSFISSLKVPAIVSDFSHLKMLGHVYVVEDAKDLAQIVRDVTRYGGAYRPEDIYEFIQRRSDWKKIEKTVDKTMFESWQCLTEKFRNAF